MNQPSDGCSSAYSGHPIYQTEWLVNDGAFDWVELGSGHQCNGTYNYWFRGYGAGGVWHSLGYGPAGGTGVEREFAIYLQSNNNYVYKIGGGLVQQYNWGISFDNAQAGLESYSDFPTGVGWHYYSGLDYTYNRGAWQSWAGQDAANINPQMCGTWAAANRWAAAENALCG